MTESPYLWRFASPLRILHILNEEIESILTCARRIFTALLLIGGIGARRLSRLAGAAKAAARLVTSLVLPLLYRPQKGTSNGRVEVCPISQSPQ